MAIEESILNSVKKVLSIAADYEAFDQDIMMHINSTFSKLQQLGIGPDNGFFIEDASTEWSEYIPDDNGYNMVRSFMVLSVGMLFDPPTTSFLIEAKNKQLEELEYRLSYYREWLLDPTDPRTVEEVVD